MAGKVMTSDALLLLTASIWGFAFVAQRAGMDYIGPFLYTGIRFLLGGMVLVPFLFVQRRRKTRPVVKKPLAKVLAGSLAGSLLFLGVSFQQVGLLYTSAGKAGFITGLYVILVPILKLIRRQRSPRGTWAGAMLAVVGLYLLSVTGGFRIGRGDFLVLMSAFFWAFHVLVIGWLSPKFESVQLAIIQFVFCGFVSLIVAFAIEEIAVKSILEAALPLAYGGVCSVGIAYTLQVVAQKKAPPAHAAIIMSLEGVFAVLGGYLLLNESLSVKGAFGCSLMLFGMLISQIAIVKAAKIPAKAERGGGQSVSSNTTSRNSS